jgi:hypothetical protein
MRLSPIVAGVGDDMKIANALAALLTLAAGPAVAQDAPPPIPAQVKALEGCWSGTGELMGKPVTITLSARPIALDAMVVVDTESQAKADPADRYAAHLLFGGRTARADNAATILGFWADSFGGDYTATGLGSPREHGFEIAYPYPDTSFVNRWTVLGDQLEWRIVAQAGAAPEKPFARYALTRAACPKTLG